MKKIKMLNRLIERLQNKLDRPDSMYMVGYNTGIKDAIQLIKDKIIAIQNIDE